MKKIYSCIICGKIYKQEAKPIRLVKQKYGTGTYKQYYNEKHFDLCVSCYNNLVEAMKGLREKYAKSNTCK